MKRDGGDRPTRVVLEDGMCHISGLGVSATCLAASPALAANCSNGLFRLETKIFWVSHRICREGFLETNKKTNYIARQKTARQIY